jgi:putative endonuclease
MMPSRKDYGSAGERQAVEYLIHQGCRIERKNCRKRFGEIDIIAWHHQVLCFVEVKSRHSVTQGHPCEAVTPAKQRSIIRVALSFLSEERLGDVPIRFDVIAIMGDGSNSVEWITNAFDARE